MNCYANSLKNKEILLRIDNTTAIAYINRYGGVQYPNLNDITWKIWRWYEDRQLFIYASYIKSKENTEADEDSRWSDIETEWSLSPSAFDKIVNTFGRVKINFFVKCKYQTNISWKRDLDAFDIDAVTINWSNYEYFSTLFPPFSLILKSLRKIINEKATGNMVVLYWPSQPWYPIFKNLSTTPIYFNQHYGSVLPWCQQFYPPSLH